MPERIPAGEDRRRNPRFSCGGLAKIHILSSDGLVVPGKIRDLGPGGCCVDATLAIKCGMRAEIVARVKAASFRAVGEVRAIRGDSSFCVEFVRLSAGGKDLLADLVADLAKLQAVMSELKSARRELGVESFRKELAGGRLRGLMLRDRIAVGGAILSAEALEPDEPVGAGADRVVASAPLVIAVDLFG